MEVRVDQNFMARVPEKHIRHSTELKLQKQIAEQDDTISLFLDLLVEQQVEQRNMNGSFRSHQLS